MCVVAPETDNVELEHDFSKMCKVLGGELEKISKGESTCRIGPVKMDLYTETDIPVLNIESEYKAEELSHSVAGIKGIRCVKDDCAIVVKEFRGSGGKSLMMTGVRAWRSNGDLIIKLQHPEIGTDVTYGTEK